MEMDWNYFIVDGVFKFKRLPKPKRTVNIIDESFHMSDAQTMKDLKKMAKDINTFNEWCINDYISMFQDGYLVEVETFWEYCDRNPYKFLGKLNILKGNIGLVEDLYYWWVFDKHGNGTAISHGEKKDWKILWINSSIKNNTENIYEKILLKFIKLEFIEVKTTSEKKYLIEFITEHAKVTDLNNILSKENIEFKGKKQDKINILLKAIESNLIKNTLIDIYKPTKNFDKWINELQIKYVELIENALKTFKYPDIYIASVWEVVYNETEGDLPLIANIVKMRQKKYFDLFDTIEKEKKEEHTRRVDSGEEYTINCISDINKEKIKKAKVIIITDEADDLTNKLYKKIKKEIQEERVKEFKKKEKRKNYFNEYKSKKQEDNGNQKLNTYLTVFIIIVFILIVLKIFS